MVDQGRKRFECRRCQHYFVTWNPDTPHGCRAFGFRSKQLPCLEVRSASGQSCLKFELKVREQNAKRGV